MATSSELARGARRRTMIPRVRAGGAEARCIDTSCNRIIENGKDSGLSSDNTTPTGSPPPRQQKIIVPPLSVVNSLVAARKGDNATRIATARTSRILRNRPGTDSPRSQDSVRTRQIASTFRPVFTGNGQSPSLSIDSSDEGSPRLERCNYHQDIVSIKTGLLKLMRVVQESGEKDLTRAETLNPFTNPMVNGLFPNLNEDGTTESTGLSNGALNVADELADLRRQVIFLQGQLEDKDRTIQQLQMQVAKQHELINSSDSPSCSSSMNGNSTLSKDICNAATQTEKIRPISAGPSLLQSLPQEGGMGPLVSWSDSWTHQSSSLRQPSLVELSSSKNTRKIIERPSKILKPKAEIISRSNGDVKVENPKSCIPSFKKFPPTFIPRANGRLHNS